jgi:5-methyltetrahydrofolate--homocysteine methyltransferase
VSIEFTKGDWERTKENAAKWWAGELKRPLVQLPVWGRDPGRPAPSLPDYGFTSFYDFSISADEIVDRWDFNMASCWFIGDAFPVVNPNFGPGVAAAFMGATLENGAETSWFRPVKQEELADVKFEYYPDNVWLNRLKDIYKAGVERWEGMVQMNMTDLGGNLDILSTFRPSEKLLFDLYDHPETVKSKTWEAHDMWWKYYDELNEIIKPVNPGYTAWSPIFSEQTYYMLQCDFCFMIGPDMFDEFVKPELAASCKRLGNAFYHLDGPGQLPHLDSLLTIPDLQGVQWIPGAGVPDWKHWPEVYRKIRDAGKLLQIYGDVETLAIVEEQLGSGEGVVLVGWCGSESEARQFMERYE